MFDQYFEKFDLAPEVAAALKKCKCIAYAETKEELEEMAYGPTHTSRYDVVYPIEGKGAYTESDMRVLCVCVSKFEVAELQETVRELDSHAFFIVQEGVRIGGNFLRKIS